MITTASPKTIGFRLALKDKVCSRTDFPNNRQNVHTPWELAREMVERLGKTTKLQDKKILVLNLEFAEVLCYDFGVEQKNIWFITDCQQKAAVIKHERYAGINVMVSDYLSWEPNMKFDVIVGNPPYQTKSDDSDTKTQPIWDKFVAKAFSLLVDNGYLCFVHPSGWRSNGNIYAEAKVLKTKQIEYLEIHNELDGARTFGANTRYDWYVAKNCSQIKSTTIKDQDGVLTTSNLTNASYIPNSKIDLIKSFLAKNDEEKVEIIHSFSAYESRKDWVSKKKSKKCKYPIIYSTPTDGPTIWYSSTNQNGHFGISKLILNPCRPIGFVVDSDGKYGMSQFCVGIVGDKEYLEMVANVITNQKTNGFAEFMEACHFTDKIFNKDVISLLRKDFWKHFVDGKENKI